MEWIGENARPFAWDDAFDEPRDPYRILVAELMLTRTNAVAAEAIYERFIAKFPTLASINGSDSEVAKLFEGLGLKKRASRMPELFRQLANEYHGIIPRTYSKLTSLYGIGPYVANAVLCFAFGRAVVPVDVNVIRVITRLFGVCHDDKKRFQVFVNGLLDPYVDPGAFALSLMEMGALVCRVKRPLCEKCPVSDNCAFGSL
ncbi:MAG: hypothetical protein P1Q69_21460 [Candidatus Thorarchaeota archaeon]|nr:hypothetical protein [Candidatus Thorarchaeota archaeon]